MREPGLISALCVFFIAAHGCAIPDSDRCLDGFYFEGDNCYKEMGPNPTTPTDDPGIPLFDAGPTDAGGSDYGFGDPCSCDGDECEMMGVPLYAAGPIIGCDMVPRNWPGAARVCLRSYRGTMKEDAYFANGYCSLMAVKCVGDKEICKLAVAGDYEKMVACPPGAVMVTDSCDVHVATFKVTVYVKYCAPPCSADDECRNDETDPIFNGEQSQYQCCEIDGTEFCFDPRNLTENTSAREF